MVSNFHKGWPRGGGVKKLLPSDKDVGTVIIFSDKAEKNKAEVLMSCRTLIINVVYRRVGIVAKIY